MVEMMTPLSANVLRLRKAAGLSQQKLATAAGLSISIISQIEQGATADPRGSTLRAIAGALGVGLDALFALPSEEEPKPRKK